MPETPDPTAVSARDEITTPDHDTTFHVVQDIDGTPESKRIRKHNFEKPIITSEVSSATPSINVDVCDNHVITALADAISGITIIGTPYHGQTLIIEITDNGTNRAITWGASFRSTDISLPTTTTANKLLRVGFMYDSLADKWDCVAKAEVV